MVGDGVKRLSIGCWSGWFLLSMVLVTGCSSVPQRDLMRYHHVMTGDTLYSIAWRYGLDYRELARWNQIAAPNYPVEPGQRLVLLPPNDAKLSGPPPQPVVEKGVLPETMVVKRFGVTVTTTSTSPSMAQPDLTPAALTAAAPAPALPSTPPSSVLSVPVAVTPAPPTAVVTALPAERFSTTTPVAIMAPEGLDQPIESLNNLTPPAAIVATAAPVTTTIETPDPPTIASETAVAATTTVAATPTAVSGTSISGTDVVSTATVTNSVPVATAPAIADRIVATIAKPTSTTPSIATNTAPTPKPAVTPAETPRPAAIRPLPPATRPASTPLPPATTEPATEARGGVVWQWPAVGAIAQSFAPDEGVKGIDIRGEVGERVRAAAAGEVVYSGRGLTGYGNLLIIKHNNVFLSAYGHNRKLLVAEGQQVRAGEPIAEMGQTAKTGSILHFEIRRNGTPVDPNRYLPPR